MPEGGLRSRLRSHSDGGADDEHRVEIPSHTSKKRRSNNNNKNRASFLSVANKFEAFMHLFKLVLLMLAVAIVFSSAHVLLLFQRNAGTNVQTSLRVDSFIEVEPIQHSVAFAMLASSHVSRVHVAVSTYNNFYPDIPIVLVLPCGVDDDTYVERFKVLNKASSIRVLRCEPADVGVGEASVARSRLQILVDFLKERHYKYGIFTTDEYVLNEHSKVSELLQVAHELDMGLPGLSHVLSPIICDDADADVRVATDAGDGDGGSRGGRVEQKSSREAQQEGNRRQNEGGSSSGATTEQPQQQQSSDASLSSTQDTEIIAKTTRDVINGALGQDTEEGRQRWFDRRQINLVSGSDAACDHSAVRLRNSYSSFWREQRGLVSVVARAAGPPLYFRDRFFRCNAVGVIQPFFIAKISILQTHLPSDDVMRELLANVHSELHPKTHSHAEDSAWNPQHMAELDGAVHLSMLLSIYLDRDSRVKVLQCNQGVILKTYSYGRSRFDHVLHSKWAVEERVTLLNLRTLLRQLDVQGLVSTRGILYRLPEYFSSTLSRKQVLPVIYPSSSTKTSDVGDALKFHVVQLAVYLYNAERRGYDRVDYPFQRQWSSSAETALTPADLHANDVEILKMEVVTACYVLFHVRIRVAMSMPGRKAEKKWLDIQGLDPWHPLLLEHSASEQQCAVSLRMQLLASSVAGLRALPVQPSYVPSISSVPGGLSQGQPPQSGHASVFASDRVLHHGHDRSICSALHSSPLSSSSAEVDVVFGCEADKLLSVVKVKPPQQTTDSTTAGDNDDASDGSKGGMVEAEQYVQVVFFATVVQNRCDYVRRTVENLRTLINPYYEIYGSQMEDEDFMYTRENGQLLVYVVISDFESSDCDVSAELGGFHGKKSLDTLDVYVHVVPQRGARFSRSGGLNAALAHMNDVTSRLEELSSGISKGVQWLGDEKVFIIDTSILLPNNFLFKMASSIICGSTLYAPVVIKLHMQSHQIAIGVKNEHDALAYLNPLHPETVYSELLSKSYSTQHYSVYSGYGMIGTCLCDLLTKKMIPGRFHPPLKYSATIGPYNVHRWGDRWGHEDGDVFNRLMSLGHLVPVRRVDPGVFHVQFSEAHHNHREENEAKRTDFAIGGESFPILSTSHDSVWMAVARELRVRHLHRLASRNDEFEIDIQRIEALPRAATTMGSLKRSKQNAATSLFLVLYRITYRISSSSSSSSAAAAAVAGRDVFTETRLVLLKDYLAAYLLTHNDVYVFAEDL